uniref:Uncharacterized protein n=1 Tax=Quercus lobata TaxID=97700 RepID=A0A7N2N4G3_QUELO
MIKSVGHQAQMIPSLSKKLIIYLDQQRRFNSKTRLQKKDWMKLWNVKIHERLKLMLWKLAWDILPARGVLLQRFQLRNKVLHDKMGVDPIAFVRETNKAFESHWKAWKEHSLYLKNLACWNPPLLDGL